MPEHRELCEPYRALCHELIAGTDDFDLSCFLASPDWKRRPPVAVPANRPVTRIPEPLTESAIPDVPWDPIRFSILREEILFNFLYRHKPRTRGVREERRIAAPAMRVAVANRVVREVPAMLFEVLDHLLIRCHGIIPFWLCIESYKICSSTHEEPINTDMWKHIHSLCFCNGIAIFPCCRSKVHDASPILITHFHRFVRYHFKYCVAVGARLTALFRGRDNGIDEVREERLVALPYELLCTHRAHDLVLSPREYFLDELLCEDVGGAAC